MRIINQHYNVIVSELETIIGNLQMKPEEYRLKNNNNLSNIVELLSDAADSLEILDTNPDALRVAKRRIHSCIKFANEQIININRDKE